MKTEKNINNFLDIAKEYCLYLDKLRKEDKVIFLNRILSLLVQIYQLALLLPNQDELEISSDKDNPYQINLSDDKMILLSEILGEHNIYKMIFDPYDLKDNENCMGALTDDLSDIYKDLKESLSLYQDHQQDALWDFKFSFETHWGKHCVDAIKAIHELIYTYVGKE